MQVNIIDRRYGSHLETLLRCYRHIGPIGWTLSDECTILLVLHTSIGTGRGPDECDFLRFPGPCRLFIQKPMGFAVYVGSDCPEADHREFYRTGSKYSHSLGQYEGNVKERVPPDFLPTGAQKMQPDDAGLAIDWQIPFNFSGLNSWYWNCFSFRTTPIPVPHGKACCPDSGMWSTAFTFLFSNGLGSHDDMSSRHQFNFQHERRM